MRKNKQCPYGWQLTMRSKRKQTHVETAYKVFQLIRADLLAYFTPREVDIIGKAVYFHDVGYDTQAFKGYDYHEIVGAEFLKQCYWICGEDTLTVAVLIAHHGLHSQYMHIQGYDYDASKLNPYPLYNITKGLDMLNIVDFCDLTAFEERIVSSLDRYKDIHNRMVASGTASLTKLEFKEKHITHFSLLCERKYGINLVNLLGVVKYNEYIEALK